eukprot:PRCOL_00005848-RA
MSCGGAPLVTRRTRHQHAADVSTAVLAGDFVNLRADTSHVSIIRCKGSTRAARGRACAAALCRRGGRRGRGGGARGRVPLRAPRALARLLIAPYRRSPRTRSHPGGAMVKFEDCDRLMVAQSAMYGAYALATGLDPSRANKTFYNDSVMSNSHKGATQWCSAHLAGLSAVHGAMSTVSLSKDDRRKLAWVGTGAHAAQAGICAYQRENLGLDKTQAALGFGINLVLAGANLRKALED